MSMHNYGECNDIHKERLCRVLHTDTSKTIPINDIQFIVNNKHIYNKLLIDEFRCFMQMPLRTQSFCNNEGTQLLSNNEGTQLSCNDKGTNVDDYNVYVLMLLIGEIKCEDVFEDVMEVLMMDKNYLENKFGGILHESVHQILAAIYNGNYEIIEKAILNNHETHKYSHILRSLMIETLIILCYEERIDTNKLYDTIKKLLNDIIESKISIEEVYLAKDKEAADNIYDVSYISYSILKASEYFKFEDLIDDIEKLYINGLVDESLDYT